MEISTGVPPSKENVVVEGCRTDRETKKASENVANAPVFINHAAIAWEESRRKWTGNSSQKSESKKARDQIISWSMTYEDLLSTNEPFAERIPLPEMVDFLADIWYDEGLFDYDYENVGKSSVL